MNGHALLAHGEDSLPPQMTIFAVEAPLRKYYTGVHTIEVPPSHKELGALIFHAKMCTFFLLDNYQSMFSHTFAAELLY